MGRFEERSDDEDGLKPPVKADDAVVVVVVET